jgi:hypothetical protein
MKSISQYIRDNDAYNNYGTIFKEIQGWWLGDSFEQ